MFRIFMTPAARARRDAHNWLEVADRVYHYRRDELKDADLRELNQRRNDVRSCVRKKADAGRCKLAIEALEPVLRRLGGRVYPRTTMADNIEFFLAAAIVILGIRAYFVQPFKIPTNSMWPSYFGMKHEVYVDPANAPGPLARVFRLLVKGAVRHEIVAPTAGELGIPLVAAGSRIIIPYEMVSGRKWLLVPTQLREYTFLLDRTPVRFRVPGDFDVDTMIVDTYANGQRDLNAATDAWRKAGKLASIRGEQAWLFRTGRQVEAGDTALAFDVLTGDLLFVDRFTYHFIKPEVGQGFVFRTNHIAGIGRDEYYIKRLVGLPGDVIEIREPVLYRNDRPIEGAAAFDRNARREGLYRGYFNSRRDGYGGRYLFPNEKLPVPENYFFALGDNSGNSADGRVWGFIPEKDVVGRPLVIYYPFTRRWGPTR